MDPFTTYSSPTFVMKDNNILLSGLRMRIHNTLMRILIRIQLFTLMRVRIQLLPKAMNIFAYDLLNLCSTFCTCAMRFSKSRCQQQSSTKLRSFVYATGRHEALLILCQYLIILKIHYICITASGS